MPQEYIRDNVFLTASPAKTFSPVMGHIPPLANVAAITLADSAFTSTEQSYKTIDSINYLVIHTEYGCVEKLFSNLQKLDELTWK